MARYIVHPGTKTVLLMDECVVVTDFGDVMKQYDEALILNRAISQPSIGDFADELQDLVDRYFD